MWHYFSFLKYFTKESSRMIYFDYKAALTELVRFGSKSKKQFVVAVKKSCQKSIANRSRSTMYNKYPYIIPKEMLNVIPTFKKYVFVVGMSLIFKVFEF